MQEHQNTEQDQNFSVIIKPITDPLQKKSLQEALVRIDEMNKKLDFFYNTIFTGYSDATALLMRLQRVRLVKEEPQKEQTDRSVVTYLELLLAIKNEIERERLILVEMDTTTEEKSIKIQEPATTTNFDSFLAQKVKSTKIQTKKIETSLRVSFSRYQHWINQTIAKLNRIEEMFNMQFIGKKVAAAPAADHNH